MNYEYLTPEDQLLLDPYGLNRSALMAIPLTGSRYNPPSSWYSLTPYQAFDKLRRIRNQHDCDKHRPYFNYVDEMDAKCGPQGGYYSRTKMYELLTPYYSNAQATRSMHQALRLGRDFLIKRVKQLLADFGYPQDVQSAIYRTNAACPTGLMKGDYLAEVIGMKPWRHMFPALLGQRRMRNKDRLIFQDSVCNVRYIEDYLNSCRYWLKHHLPEYFGSWCNPQVYVNPTLTDSLQHHDYFVETDYKSMDVHFSLWVTTEVVLPVYEVLKPNGFISFAAAVEELFHQPVYLGDRLAVGLHNLFSGEGITNDFETIYTVCLAIGTALQLQCRDIFRMVALGDDCTIALRTRSATLPQKFRDLMIEVSSLADMIIHDDEKSRIAVEETRFCRKVYYLAGAKDAGGSLLGAYPLNLALNNIIQPERIQSNPAIAAVADLQRLDNCYGVPGWAEMVQMCWANSTHKFAKMNPDAYTKDWWLRVYGEKWSPECSPTVQFIQKMHSQHNSGLFYHLI